MILAVEFMLASPPEPTAPSISQRLTTKGESTLSASPTPTLDRGLPVLRASLHSFCGWFLQPAVLIRVVLYLTGLIYIRTVLFDYVFDDSFLIVINPWMASWKCVPAIFTHSFWGFLEIPRVIDFYRPLVMLSFAAIYHVLGPAPGWFHLMTASVHVAATYLVYRLARETTNDQTLSVIAAGIFGLHPTRVETAAWISGLSDSLSVVFLLSSLVYYFRWKKEESARTSRLLWLSALLLLLALLSKEAVIVVPLLIAIYEVSAGRCKFLSNCRNALNSVWPFLAVTLVAVTIRRLVVHNPTGQILNGVSPAAALFSAPQAILWYLGKQLWPVGLSPYYALITVKGFSIARFLLPLLLLLVLSAAVAYAVGKNPIGIFYTAWFLITLAPVVVYEPILQVHDRYSYLPSIAGSIGLAYLVTRMKRFGPLVQGITVLTLLTLIAALTFTYESYWDNDEKLFTRAIQIAPKNPDAAEYLASVYVNSHQPEKAEAVARTLMNDADLSAQGWYILGTVRAISDEDYISARDAIEKSCELFGHHNFLSNMGLASVDMKLGRDEEAVEIYHDELKTYPNVAYIHGQLALALQHMGRSDEAAHELELQRRSQ